MHLNVFIILWEYHWQIKKLFPTTKLSKVLPTTTSFTISVKNRVFLSVVICCCLSELFFLLLESCSLDYLFSNMSTSWSTCHHLQTHGMNKEAIRRKDYRRRRRWRRGAKWYLQSDDFHLYNCDLEPATPEDIEPENDKKKSYPDCYIWPYLDDGECDGDILARTFLGTGAKICLQVRTVKHGAEIRQE